MPTVLIPSAGTRPLSPTQRSRASLEPDGTGAPISCELTGRRIPLRTLRATAGNDLEARPQHLRLRRLCLRHPDRSAAAMTIPVSARPSIPTGWSLLIPTCPPLQPGPRFFVALFTAACPSNVDACRCPDYLADPAYSSPSVQRQLRVLRGGRCAAGQPRRLRPPRRRGKSLGHFRRE